MTIKRRLFISNILMIIIPAVLAVLVSVACIAAAWAFMYESTGAGKAAFYDFDDDNIERLFSAFLEDDLNEDQRKEIAKLEKIMERSGIRITLMQGDEHIYSFGAPGRDDELLIEAASALGGEGTVSIDEDELTVEEFEWNDVTYTVYLFANYKFYQDGGIQWIVQLLGVVLLCIVVIIVLITNRFLTRFVFRKIEEPLEILGEGVHHIRDGNLDCRIHYREKNEFSPICEDFNEMAERLKASVDLTQKHEQSRKELLAGISHDLRSPLTSVKAYTDGLLDGVANEPEKQEQYLRMIRKKADEIDQMVSKLFLFSKMDMGDYPVYPETLDIHEELLDFVTAAEEYEERGMTVVAASLAENASVYVDPVQLRSVLTNILENSLRYKTGEHGTVKIESVKLAHSVRIIIEDDGPGVPNEALDKIYDAFYRNDPSRSNPNQGSGLGLAISAKAVAQMGGRIYSENIETGGLRTIIEIPLKEEASVITTAANRDSNKEAKE